MHLMSTAILPGFSTLMRHAPSSAQAAARVLGGNQIAEHLWSCTRLWEVNSHISRDVQRQWRNAYTNDYISIYQVPEGHWWQCAKIISHWNIWIRLDEMFYEFMGKCIDFLVCQDVKCSYVLFSIVNHPQKYAIIHFSIVLIVLDVLYLIAVSSIPYLRSLPKVIINYYSLTTIQY